MKNFSVITATYNRERLLTRLYSSLLTQTYQNFEWIIVDDGSTDMTVELVERWKKEKKIAIKLVKQKNIGKHRAINNGVKYCCSKWIAIIDSDDWLTENALSCAATYIYDLSMNENKNIAGLIFNSLNKDGSILGTEFPHEIYCGKTFQYYQDNKITGDKFDFYKTKVIQENPFPEIDGERFISEGVIWNRINKRYLCYFINEGHQYVEYQARGLSDLSCLSRVLSPTGSCLCYYESSQLPISTKRKLRNLTNYYRFRFHGGKGGRKLIVLNPLLDSIAYFLGGGAYLRDKYLLWSGGK